MNENLGDRWCVLRTAPARTLKLAASLNGAGVECWTPVASERRQKARSKVKVERRIAITPTYVFARAAHLAELRRIHTLPVNPHPAFSIMRHLGQVVTIRDAEIERLRIVEAKAVPKARRRTFEPGTAVQRPEGPFAGLTGIVQASDGRWTLVLFGKLSVKVDTCELRPEDVLSASPEREPLR